MIRTFSFGTLAMLAIASSWLFAYFSKSAFCSPSIEISTIVAAYPVVPSPPYNSASFISK
jgi:hypothetical protein